MHARTVLQRLLAPALSQVDGCGLRTVGQLRALAAGFGGGLVVGVWLVDGGGVVGSALSLASLLAGAALQHLPGIAQH